MLVRSIVEVFERSPFAIAWITFPNPFTVVPFVAFDGLETLF